MISAEPAVTLMTLSCVCRSFVLRANIVLVVVVENALSCKQPFTLAQNLNAMIWPGYATKPEVRVVVQVCATCFSFSVILVLTLTSCWRYIVPTSAGT